MSETVELGRIYIQLSSNREQASFWTSVWKIIDSYYETTESTYGSPGERDYVVLQNLKNESIKVVPCNMLKESHWFISEPKTLSEKMYE